MHPFYYSLGVFGVMEFLGDVYPGYIANQYCFSLLGCNLGPFGYEGLLHFVSGICVGLGLVWAHERGHMTHAFSARTFLGISLVIAAVWEILEWGYDLVRMYIFGMDLLIPNRFAQPNLIDMIGDTMLALVGTALVYAWTRYTQDRVARAA